MGGFLHLQLPVQLRALVTRLVAITPCVLVSVLFPERLNDLINIVNAALSFLLPSLAAPLLALGAFDAGKPDLGASFSAVEEGSIARPRPVLDGEGGGVFLFLSGFPLGVSVLARFRWPSASAACFRFL